MKPFLRKTSWRALSFDDVFNVASERFSCTWVLNAVLCRLVSLSVVFVEYM